MDKKYMKELLAIAAVWKTQAVKDYAMSKEPDNQTGRFPTELHLSAEVYLTCATELQDYVMSLMIDKFEATDD